MTFTEIKNHIRKFNADATIALFREKFAAESFFDVIDKSRSESSHSSFVAWMLSRTNVCCDANNLPIVRLLDILTERAPVSGLDTAILSRKLKVCNIQAHTEYPISTLAEKALVDYSDTSEHQQLLMDIATQVQDRADIVLDVAVEGVNDIHSIQIIIENKIDSKEGRQKRCAVKAYDKLSQTGRYYLASKRETSSVVQYYVYLTPVNTPSCQDEHYIHLTYQDLLDNIIEPLLMSPSLSYKTKLYLEEYKDEITFPHMSLYSYTPSLAFAHREHANDLSNLWSCIRRLVFTALSIENNLRLWCINGQYFQDLKDAKVAALRLLMSREEAWLIDNEFISYEVKEGWVKVDEEHIFWYNPRKPLAISRCSQLFGIPCESILPVEYDMESRQLLMDFWQENCMFIASLATSLSRTEFADDYCLVNSIMQKRDTSKYYVYFDGHKKNDRPDGKGDTAFLIIKEWVAYMSASRPELSIDDVRSYFPIDLHSYYKKGKWFKYLIYPYNKDDYYEYDGLCNGHPVNSGWDFFSANHPAIELPSGQKITILKMWRKSNLEELLNHISNKNDDFAQRLKVIRA